MKPAVLSLPTADKLVHLFTRPVLHTNNGIAAGFGISTAAKNEKGIALKSLKTKELVLLKVITTK